MRTPKEREQFVEKIRARLAAADAGRMVNAEETAALFEERTGSTAPSAAQAKRTAAARQHDFAQRKVEDWSKTVANATRRLRDWQQRANRYARQANLTDAEIAAQSEAGRRANAAKPVVRALKLPKGGAA